MLLILYAQCHKADYQPANGMSRDRQGLGDVSFLQESWMEIGQAGEHSEVWTPERGVQASQEDHPEDILDLQSPKSNGYD